MTTYRPGDLVLVAFPFAGDPKRKNRPALVVLDGGDRDVLVARVTTKIHTTMYDVAIRDWREAGLLRPSVVRLHKLATLEKRLIRCQLGSLSDADRDQVAKKLNRWVGM